MRPVLLPRTEIDKRRNEERRQLLVEGTRVAERVDTLRETAASEEAAFEKYRVESLRGVQEEINAKHLENEQLERDIAKKREEWNQLMQPIDKNWMWFVKSEKMRIESQVKENTSLDANLSRKLADTELARKENEQKASFLSIEEAKLKQLVAQAQIKVSAASEIEAKARNQAHKITIQAQLRDQESEKRAQKVKEAMDDLTIREKELEKEKNDLQTREFKVLAKELAYYSPVKKI